MVQGPAMPMRLGASSEGKDKKQQPDCIPREALAWASSASAKMPSSSETSYGLAF